MRRGYVRIAAADDDTSEPVAALRAAGVAAEAIVVEEVRGARSDRPLLDALLGELEGGDVLVVASFDHLACSLLQLVHVGEALNEHGTDLHAIAEGIDTRVSPGRPLLTTLSMLAEFQKELGSRTTREGLAVARSKGRRAGRPPRLDPRQAAEAQRLYDAGHSVARIAAHLGVPRTTIYGHVQRGAQGEGRT